MRWFWLLIEKFHLRQFHLVVFVVSKTLLKATETDSALLKHFFWTSYTVCNQFINYRFPCFVLKMLITWETLKCFKDSKIMLSLTFRWEILSFRYVCAQPLKSYLCFGCAVLSFVTLNHFKKQFFFKATPLILIHFNFY